MILKLIAAALLTISVFAADAQRQPANGHNKIHVLSVTSRRTLPGRKEAQPVTDYRIIAVWNSRHKPAGFFWLTENSDWMACRVALAHKKATEPQGYAIKPADLARIRCGDTLEFVPVPENLSKPQHIPAQKTNTLFFTAPAGKWWYVTPAKISRQPDVILP